MAGFELPNAGTKSQWNCDWAAQALPRSAEICGFPTLSRRSKYRKEKSTRNRVCDGRNTSAKSAIGLVATCPLSGVRARKADIGRTVLAKDRFRPMCGRPSVGKWRSKHRIAGWCGHVSDLLVRLKAPLVLMPFARFGSRSIART